MQSNDLELNLAAVAAITTKFKTQFTPLLERCPGLSIILAQMLVLRFGFWVIEVNWTNEMKDWTETDFKHVGKSMAYFLRMFQTGVAAVDAWRRNYPQLDDLFEIDGFKDFMEVIASHLLRINKYGMSFRVSVGALLSAIDAATDIYVFTSHVDRASEASEAVRTPAGATTRHFRIARLAITSHCLC